MSGSTLAINSQLTCNISRCSGYAETARRSSWFRARVKMLPSPIAMHIPDGFLSVQVSILCWFIAILVIAYSLKRVGTDLGEKQVPIMGMLAAAIFAGQLLNFAVAGGTSGHLIGAALATIF